jgi:predicted transcriptional regulator
VIGGSPIFCLMQRMNKMAEIEQVVEIVAKYLRHNTVAATEVPGVIDTVRAAMSRLGQSAEIAVGGLTPAISARRSVTEKAITCMDCGWSGQTIKRHLLVAHNTRRTNTALGGSLRTTIPW